MGKIGSMNLSEHWFVKAEAQRVVLVNGSKSIFSRDQTNEAGESLCETSRPKCGMGMTFNPCKRKRIETSISEFSFPRTRPSSVFFGDTKNYRATCNGNFILLNSVVK